MQGFLITLAACSVTMSALALFYMAVTPLLAKRYSITGRYYAWLVIVLGLIIPFRPRSGNAVVKVHVPVNKPVPFIRTGTGAPMAVPVDSTTPSLPYITVWQMAAAVWLLGMIAFLAYHVIRHYRFLKLAARWSEGITDNQTLVLFQDLKDGMGISRPMELKVCSSIGTPMMAGFICPCILLPKAGLPEDGLSFVLKHELIHYRRRDLWYKCLVLAATAIHWFNPIVYMMAKVIDIQCELSCDKEVIRCADADTRQYYSETVISVARYQSRQKTALSTDFYGSRQSLRERIESIMDMSKKKSGIAVLCTALVLTMGTGTAFAAKAETEGIPGQIKEDIMVSPTFSYGYRFHADPETYAVYSSYGITVPDDGKMLLYDGERVRLFVDGHSDAETFFLGMQTVILPGLSVFQGKKRRNTVPPSLPMTAAPTTAIPRTVRKRRRRLWQAKPNLVHIPLMVLLFRQIIRYYIIRTSVLSFLQMNSLTVLLNHSGMTKPEPSPYQP